MILLLKTIQGTPEEYRYENTCDTERGSPIPRKGETVVNMKGWKYAVVGVEYDYHFTKNTVLVSLDSGVRRHLL